MPTDRLARFRSWPTGVYNDELAKLWRAEHPQRSAVIEMPTGRAAGTPRRLAVICHVYYVDLLDEVLSALVNLPRSTDVFVSVVSEQDRETVVDRLSGATDAQLDVRVVENRGRDIAPKYVAFADVYDQRYELVLFLHTKKSTFEHVGTPWRRYLFTSLAGSSDRVDSILAAFDRDPDLGVLAPQHFGEIAADTTWQGTFLYAARLARRMGVSVRRWSPPDFASGSMFWARPAALASITGLHLRIEEFPPEARQVTATNMHALERLVFLAAQRGGFTVGLLPEAGEIPSPAIVDRAGRPPISMWLRAVPPTVRRMAADVEIRRKRFSPARLLARSG